MATDESQPNRTPARVSGAAGPDDLSDADIRKVAALARLDLGDDRVGPLRQELSAVLGYIARLRELDLSDVEPLAHVGDRTNRLRDDTPGDTLPTQTLMDMAPDPQPPVLGVPKVLGQGGGA